MRFFNCNVHFIKGFLALTLSATAAVSAIALAGCAGQTPRQSQVTTESAAILPENKPNGIVPTASVSCTYFKNGHTESATILPVNKPNGIVPTASVSCTHFENGQQEQCSTRDRKTGEVVHRVQFYESGVTKSEMRFRDGVLRETSYYPSGKIQRTVHGDTIKGRYESGKLQYRFVNEVSYHSFYEDGKPKTEEFAISEKFRTVRHFQPDGRHDYDAIMGNLQGPQFKRIFAADGSLQEEYSCYHQKTFYPSGNLKFQVDYTDTTATYILYLDQPADPENPAANVKEKIVRKAGEAGTEPTSDEPDEVRTEPSNERPAAPAHSQPEETDETRDVTTGNSAEPTGEKMVESGAKKVKPFVPEQYQATCRELENLLATNPAVQKFLNQQ